MNSLQKNEFLPVYMKIDQQNHYLFTSDINGSIVIYDVRRMQLIKELRLGFGFMKIQIQNNTIIFLSKERKLFYYDLQKDKKTKVISVENKIQFSSFTTMDQKGDQILLAGFDGNLYETVNGNRQQANQPNQIQGHVTSMETIFIKEKAYVFIGTEQGKLYQLNK